MTPAGRFRPPTAHASSWLQLLAPALRRSGHPAAGGGGEGQRHVTAAQQAVRWGTGSGLPLGLPSCSWVSVPSAVVRCAPPSPELRCGMSKSPNFFATSSHTCRQGLFLPGGAARRALLHHQRRVHLLLAAGVRRRQAAAGGADGAARGGGAGQRGAHPRAGGGGRQGKGLGHR